MTDPKLRNLKVSPKFFLSAAALAAIVSPVAVGIAHAMPGHVATRIHGTVAAQAVPQRVRVSAGVMTGLLIKKVNPQYPEEARNAGIQGVVLLKATISKEGDVENLQLISGHPKLAPAAIEAVKQWKYKPYLLNGDHVVVETQIQVNFALSK